jgi:hypothetical protein
MNKVIVIFVFLSILFSCSKETVKKEIQEKSIIDENQEESISLVFNSEQSELNNNLSDFNSEQLELKNNLSENKIEFESSVISIDGIEAFIYKNTINIMDSPSVYGQIIGKHYFGEIVLIYEESGTKELQNGVYDLWYKISQNDNKWINALSFNQFPFYVLSVEKDYDFNPDAYDMSYTYKGIIEIFGYEFVDEKMFLKMYVNMYSTMNIYPLTVELEIDDLHYRILDNKYMNFLELVSDFCNIRNTIGIIKSEFKEENKINYGRYEFYEEYSTSDFYAFFAIRGSGGLFRELKLLTSRYILKYGINVGLSIDTVIELIGDPHTKTYEEAIYYSGYYHLNLSDDRFIDPCRLRFELLGNTVNKIYFDQPGP